MPDFIPIDELVADIDRACKDDKTPAWVSVLLRTVLALVTAMQSRFSQLEESLEDAEAQNAKLRKELYGRKSERRP